MRLNNQLVLTPKVQNVTKQSISANIYLEVSNVVTEARNDLID